MERRLLLVFALTFLVILIFQPVLKRFFPQAPATQEQKQEQKAEPAQSQAQIPPSPPPPPPQASSSPKPAKKPGKATAEVAGAKQASSEAETVIENDLYRITFTNRGGQVKSWVLKKYDDEQGKPLDLVNSAAAAKYGYPLSLWSYDEGLRNKLNSVLYVPSQTGDMKAPSTITFEYADQDVSVRKTFKFDHTYMVDVSVAVEVKDNPVPAFPMWPAGFGDELTPASYGASQIEYQNDSKIERLAAKKISGGNTVRGPFDWSGVADQYFAAVFIPEDTQDSALITLRNSLEIPKDHKKPNSTETTKVEVLGAGVGNLKGATTERMYVGPKSLQVLEAVSVPAISDAPKDLRGLVNFGFFGVIARPLFLWLKWTHKYVPNWGWAIVFQTLIINLALLPLRISSMKSALKMQKVQPQMTSIKEKYKKYSMRDPRKQEMNQEIAALMKKEGVSPAGGCLPMIIQMPFLFAYYSMLGSALELRHAPWLWIHDLSAPDPFYLLPIGIIITMLITQKMTPQAGMDPAQQKMMTLMMPLMMGIISFNLAAGLCLYWSEGNLIAIAQQAIMNRTSLGREMREMAAKRARKKDK